MNQEEQIISQMEEKFPFLQGKLRCQKAGRLWSAPLFAAEFEPVFAFVTGELGFDNFHMLVGLDKGENFEVIYVLSNQEHIMLQLVQSTPRHDPVVKSINGVFPNSLFHERELEDLFGVKVEGLPAGPRYPLPDGWPEGQHPLRKDWNTKYFDKKSMTYNPPEEKAAPAETQAERPEKGGSAL
ncbi:MAG: NADH-quinone oxidoreductase subunit C [Clostridiales bacterium]|nr:NADH-quinone oxidoreductase subunit C [Clostridiales bacterium]